MRQVRSVKVPPVGWLHELGVGKHTRTSEDALTLLELVQLELAGRHACGNRRAGGGGGWEREITSSALQALKIPRIPKCSARIQHVGL